MKQINFKINNMTWKITYKDTKTLIAKLNSRCEEKVFYVFGLTLYDSHEIWINGDLCFEQQIKTLKHELTHCYMWSMGMHNVIEYNEEFICDLVSASNDFINEVVEKYKIQMS